MLVACKWKVEWTICNSRFESDASHWPEWWWPKIVCGAACGGYCIRWPSSLARLAHFGRDRMTSLILRREHKFLLHLISMFSSTNRIVLFWLWSFASIHIWWTNNVHSVCLVPACSSPTFPFQRHHLFMFIVLQHETLDAKNFKEEKKAEHRKQTLLATIADCG